MSKVPGPEDDPTIKAAFLAVIERERPDLGPRTIELYRAAISRCRARGGQPDLAAIMRWIARNIGPGPGARRRPGRPEDSGLEREARYIAAVRELRRHADSTDDDRVAEELGIEPRTLRKWRAKYGLPFPREIL